MNTTPQGYSEYTLATGLAFLRGEPKRQPVQREALRSHLRKSPEDLSELISEAHRSISFEDFLRHTKLPFKLVQEAARASNTDDLWAFTQERRERIQSALEMVKQGMTLAEIGDHYGKTTEMIRKDLLEIGIRTPELKKMRRNVIINEIRNRTEQGENRKDIAAALGMENAEVGRLAKEGGFELNRTLKRDIHGSIPCYNAGCRCDLCKEAHYNRMTDSKKKRLAKEVPSTIHGTYSGYLNWDCRCEPCKEAKQKHDANESAESLKNDHRTHKMWSAEEDAVVMDYSMTANQIALQLGRTLNSVRARRTTLNSR